MKYIFIVGAPGSKWSSVCKNIYFSPDIDNSDYSTERLYSRNINNSTELMHTGAYFDPGMEFGSFFDKISDYSKEECETEFDKPFSGDGIRIIKSHVFSHHIDFIKQTWHDCPVILVTRDNDKCLEQWISAGGFDITYPLYRGYYKDLQTMTNNINAQNADIAVALKQYATTTMHSNKELCNHINISPPPDNYVQIYTDDINVTVI